MERKKLFPYIIACVDPAIRDALILYFNKKFGRKQYFMPTEIGGVKDLLSPDNPEDRKHLLRKMRKAAKVHEFNLIVLVNHSNCGAYRLAGHVFDDRKAEEGFHREEMEKAAEILKKEFPGIPVKMHYFLKAEQKIAW